jgi:hypothetical protein
VNKLATVRKRVMDCRASGDDALYLLGLVDELRDQVIRARLASSELGEALWTELAGGEPPVKPK